MTVNDFVDEHYEELTPEMNDAGGHSHWAGVSSGSSSSSSTGSSSCSTSTYSDPLCAVYFYQQYTEDLVHLVKLIIEFYELDEIKPLFDRMNINHLASLSMYRHRVVGPVPKKEEKHIDDELFEI